MPTRFDGGGNGVLRSRTDGIPRYVEPAFRQTLGCPLPGVAQGGAGAIRPKSEFPVGKPAAEKTFLRGGAQAVSPLKHRLKNGPKESKGRADNTGAGRPQDEGGRVPVRFLAGQNDNPHRLVKNTTQFWVL